MKKTRGFLKELAKERANILIETVLKTSKDDMELAERQASMARKICMKFNVRLPYDKKQIYCKGCKKLIIPGKNSRVRLGFKPKALKITCLRCGHIYRKVLLGGRQNNIKKL